MLLRSWLPAIAIMMMSAVVVDACSYCNPNFQQKLTLRQNARLSKFIVYGELVNARLVGDKGATDFAVADVVAPHDTLGKQTTLTIPTFIPFNAKDPPKYLLFGEYINGKLDIVHARQVKSKAAATYLKGALQIDDKDRMSALKFCFDHLDSVDPEASEDAFHEFAKASDAEIGQVAPKLAAAKVRALLNDEKTPAERLGIYAYLLGACGTADDATLLVAMIRKGDERSKNALGGLLGGVIALKPNEGWAMVESILRTPDRGFADKLAALGTIRFYHSAKGDSARKPIAAALVHIVEQGDMADMAIEDLRRWHWWELTRSVLAQYGKPTHSAPLMKRAIVRYALCCPEAEAVAFIKARRAAEPMLVETVEEALEFEKPVPVNKAP